MLHARQERLIDKSDAAINGFNRKARVLVAPNNSSCLVAVKGASFHA